MSFAPADEPEQSALQCLLERMQHDSDFPALSEAISAINRIAASDRDGVNELSNHILKDFALTSKLLKRVNAAYYTPLGGGSISTISRAVVILGFNAVQALVRAFDFSLAAPSDVFLVALNNNADILITDIDDPKIAARIPAWYRKSIRARTFVLFPISVKAKPIGLIFAARSGPGEIAIPEKELSLLKSLRNQAVLAIRQSI
jgi:hypothetical protein